MKIITLTNAGGLRLTKNLLASCKKHLPEQDLVVACTDTESQEELEKQGFSTFLASFTSCDKETANFGTMEFRRVTGNKFPSIIKFLEEGEDVLYIDNDTWLFRNPLPYIAQFEGVDIIIQSDEPASPPLCTGFLFLKSNDTVKQFIREIISYNQTHEKIGNLIIEDQVSFFMVLDKNAEIKVGVLPRHLFPNGDALQKGDFSKEEAFFAHANFVSGMQAKIDLLKKVGGWEG